MTPDPWSIIYPFTISELKWHDGLTAISCHWWKKKVKGRVSGYTGNINDHFSSKPSFITLLWEREKYILNGTPFPIYSALLFQGPGQKQFTYIGSMVPIGTQTESNEIEVRVPWPATVCCLPAIPLARFIWCAESGASRRMYSASANSEVIYCETLISTTLY